MYLCFNRFVCEMFNFFGGSSFSSPMQVGGSKCLILGGNPSLFCYAMAGPRMDFLL